MSQCIWTGSDGARCARPVFADSEYCLFHKPNKDEAEAELFWRVINFNAFSNKLVELQNRMYSPGVSNEERIRLSHVCGDEIERIHQSNFPAEIQCRSDFEKYKKQVVDLYYKSEISGKESFSPKIRGFVYPDMSRNPFRYVYNPVAMFPDLDFTDSVFEGVANFYGFRFIGNVTFKNVSLSGCIILTNAIFDKRCIFADTDLKTSHGVYGMFQNCQFHGEEVLFQNVNGIPSFNTASFAHHTAFHLVDMHYPLDPGVASFGEDAYRVAKKQSIALGDYSRAGDYYYLERVYKRLQIENRLSKFIDWLMDLITGYGEKPIRIVISSCVVIFLFSLLYFLMTDVGVLDSVFYSTITFTTLGAKVPDNPNNFLKLALAIESLLGGLFIALMVLTISKRYSRG